MSANLKVEDSEGLGIERAHIELGDIAARLADQVMVVVLGQLVARAVPEIQPPHQPYPGEEVDRPVDGHEPDLGATSPDLLQTLVLLRRERSQYRYPLRRRLVPAPSYSSYDRLELHPTSTVDNRQFFSVRTISALGALVKAGWRVTLTKHVPIQLGVNPSKLEVRPTRSLPRREPETYYLMPRHAKGQTFRIPLSGFGGFTGRARVPQEEYESEAEGEDAADEEVTPEGVSDQERRVDTEGFDEEAADGVEAHVEE